jgi:hypothetical protein
LKTEKTRKRVQAFRARKKAEGRVEVRVFQWPVAKREIRRFEFWDPDDTFDWGTHKYT